MLCPKKDSSELGVEEIQEREEIILPGKDKSEVGGSYGQEDPQSP